jgi:cellulose biosynthesis protein BcsQ
MARITAMANQKGGVAKTTSVHALAAGLVEMGRKVLAVDLDPQASLSWSMGVEPDDLEQSLHDVLMGRIDAEEILYESNGIDLLPSPVSTWPVPRSTSTPAPDASTSWNGASNPWSNVTTTCFSTARLRSGSSPSTPSPPPTGS